MTARLLDACRSACEAGETEAAERLLALVEGLLDGDRLNLTKTGLDASRRGRPSQERFTLWREDAEGVVAAHATLWELRRRLREG